MSRLTEKNSNAYGLSEFQAFVVAKVILIGIIVIAILGMIYGVSHFASEQDVVINDDKSTSKTSVQDLEPYDYEDICGFPITNEIRLDAILEGSTQFSNDGYSYLTLRGGTFSHVELSHFSDGDHPTLQYWFTLRNGLQVFFTMDACEVEGVSDGSKMSLETSNEPYYALHPPTGEDRYEIMSAPGHFLVHSITKEPVLDVENCERIPKYYTTMQSDAMFTEENVTFDPLWKNQLFPLMDYCTDIDNFELKIIDGKRYWSFTVK